jgi:ubiquinol-cytochrome c reductase cytochrome b subunit
MLKLFPGKREVIGTFVIPSSIALTLIILPLLDRLLPAKLAHFLACAFVLTLLGGASFLTVQALRSDANDSVFQAARKKADLARDRAMELASSPDVGIPPDGSAYLLRRDPLTQGRNVLEKKCLGCHFFDGKGNGEKQTASDLAHFGSREWIRGLLTNPSAPAYFGTVPACDGMAEWKKGSKLTPKQLDDVADFVASFAKIPADMTRDEWLNSPGVSTHPGLELFQKDCGKCHAIDGLSDGGERDAPELFAWGSPQWITRMIRKPGAQDKYGYLKVEAQMPAFGADQLLQNDVDMVIRYLKEDYLKPGAMATGH